MNKHYILETCVDSVESAVQAEHGGADRLELCGNLIIGGTTPGAALFEEVRRHCSLPIHVLIRPRFGDFLYSEMEFEVLRREVRQFRELGADGLVIGLLDADGNLDVSGMRLLMEEAGDCRVTLHRAFDVCADPEKALEQAAELGIRTILTSGQAANCREGRELLKRLVELADGRIEILVGAGVSAETIAELEPYVQAGNYHMSGKKTFQSGMRFRREGVPMGLKEISEFERFETDAQEIARARAVLDRLAGENK